MKTGRLLDILSGHEGPVFGLVFSPTSVSHFIPNYSVWFPLCLSYSRSHSLVKYILIYEWTYVYVDAYACSVTM